MSPERVSVGEIFLLVSGDVNRFAFFFFLRSFNCFLSSFFYIFF